MLRVILATLGVALIAFGLFGGKSLEQVYAGLNGMLDKYTGSGDSHLVLADAGSSSDDALQQESTGIVAANDSNSENAVDQAVPVKVAEPAAESSVANNAIASASDTNAANGGSADDSKVQQAAVEPLQDSAAGTAASDSGKKLTIADVQVASSGDTAVTTATSSVDGATGADTALKEVKASARNEELELALSTANDQGAELPKEEAVGEVLKTTAGDNQVKALFVLKDLVNMREGPSIDHAVVLRLEKGQELMEFKRAGKWVHVGAYGTSGKIGWVHQRLVGKTPG